MALTQVTKEVLHNDQANITIVGTLGSLTVSGNVNVGRDILVPTFGGDYNNHLTFLSSAADDSTRIQVSPSGTGLVGQIAIASESNVANASVLELTTVSSLYTRIESGRHGDGTRLPLDIYVGGARRMRFDTSGNVGINTASPTATLHVNGNLLVSGTIIDYATTAYVQTAGQNSQGTKTVQSISAGVPSNATGNNGDIIYQY